VNKELTFKISEDIEVTADVYFDGWKATPATRDEPGEPAGVEITHIDVREVWTAMPGIAYDKVVEMTDSERNGVAKWVLMQGDILEQLQTQIMEEHK
jgi:hypothetical protein